MKDTKEHCLDGIGTHPVYLVTSSPRKIKETQQFLHNVSFINVIAYPLELDEIQSLDQKAVAIDKAQRAWNLVKKPLLVDDCGIYFDGYDNFPGTFTKFCYDAIGLEGLQRLIAQDEMKAYLQVTLIYIDGPNSYQVFQAQCHGKIVRPKAKVSAQAWGHTLFYPTGSEKSFYELYDLAAFYHYSHRRVALEQFADWFLQEALSSSKIQTRAKETQQ